ncbi:MAG: type I-E CRISPR-associated protein Cse2/CasB [Cyanobacteriota bacterium]
MVTVNSAPPKWDQAHRFLSKLHEGIKDDKGAQAALKRALSGEPRHLIKTRAIVMRHYLPQMDDWQESIWIRVACLSMYYEQPLRDNQCNFGESCRQLALLTNTGNDPNDSLSKSVQRRFQALLDTSLTDIWTPLTGLIRQMKAQKSSSIDYPKLIYELCQWDHPDQYIQDKWAKAFWKAVFPKDQS